MIPRLSFLTSCVPYLLAQVTDFWPEFMTTGHWLNASFYGILTSYLGFLTSFYKILTFWHTGTGSLLASFPEFLSSSFKEFLTFFPWLLTHRHGLLTPCLGFWHVILLPELGFSSSFLGFALRFLYSTDLWPPDVRTLLNCFHGSVIF